MQILESERRPQIAYPKDPHLAKGEKLAKATPEQVIEHGLSTVFLDVDSTVVRVEGIDMLAACRGPKLLKRIAAMTKEAMSCNGNTVFIFNERLRMIQPTEDELRTVGEHCSGELVEDAIDVTVLLRSLGIEMHLLSGGYRDIVLEIGKVVGIPAENTHANVLKFNNGLYEGLDPTIPLWTKTGKSQIIRQFMSISF